MARPMTREELLTIDRAPVIDQGQRDAILGPPGTRLTTVAIPQLKVLPPYHTGSVTCHRDIAAQLQRAFALIEQLGLMRVLLTYDGCYVDRPKRGGGGVSSHAYGAAIDLNAAWNGLGATPAARGAKGSLWEVVGIFEACGFGWGGFWSRPDGMHFEVRVPLPADRFPVLAEPEVAPGPDAPSPWAAEAWAWAQSEGLMDGTRPRDGVTREELAVVCQRLQG